MGPGDLVLCIDDDPDAFVGLIVDPIQWRDGIDGLTKGAVYTVREARSYLIQRQAVMCVWLDEIIRPNNPDGVEAPFAAARFRPISTESKAMVASLLNLMPKTAEVQ